MALLKKSGGFEKSWRFTENQADLQNPGALQKNRQTIESLQALKSPCLVKNPRLQKNRLDWKSWRPAYCLGSAESPAADFLLVWLKSSRSDPRRCVVSLMQSPSKEAAQAALLLWADSLPYCTGCLYRPDMSNFTRKSKN